MERVVVDAGDDRRPSETVPATIVVPRSVITERRTRLVYWSGALFLVSETLNRDSERSRARSPGLRVGRHRLQHALERRGGDGGHVAVGDISG